MHSFATIQTLWLFKYHSILSVKILPLVVLSNKWPLCTDKTNITGQDGRNAQWGCSVKLFAQEDIDMFSLLLILSRKFSLMYLSSLNIYLWTRGEDPTHTQPPKLQGLPTTQAEGINVLLVCFLGLINLPLISEILGIELGSQDYTEFTWLEC